MFNELLAKSEKNGEVETLVSHTKELLVRHERLKTLYPHALSDIEWQLLYDAAYYHDIGKANTKFQNKVRPKDKQIKDDFENLDEVPHGYLSCAYMPNEKLSKKYSRAELNSLYSAVYYHHERLDADTRTVKTIIENDLEKYTEILSRNFQIREELVIDYNRLISREFCQNHTEAFYQFVKIKGLLNKLDYAASAHLEVEIEPQHLTEKVDMYFAENNYTKNKLQQDLSNNQQTNQVIIASTGIGKTEAALCWIGNGKGIFTLPLKVSINAIHKRIYEEYNYKNVGLLHSDSALVYENMTNDEQLNTVALNHTKKLSMPLTITTLDQVIGFVERYPGFELKLAILAYSKLVIDEIQMYSPKMVAFLVMGLKYITDVGGQFLIMTATLPPIFIDALRAEGVPFNMPDEPYFKLNDKGQTIRRHVMDIQQRDLSAEDICNLEERKILVIVNTVKKAQALYDDLKQRGYEVNLLHSLFVKKDRQKKENAIKELGKKTNLNTGIWITTQLVEASIDIDFDVLVTELSEATGLFQRMGRVYRDREYTLTVPNVYVFTGDYLPSGIDKKSKKSVVDYTIYEKSKEVLLAYDGQEITEMMKVNIVNDIYTEAALGSDCDYIKEFNATRQRIRITLPYTENKPPNLRDIRTVTIIPTTVFRQHDEAIKKAKEAVCDLNQRLAFDNFLQQYTVSIPEWAYIKARKEKLIYGDIQVDKYRIYPIVSYQYTEEHGLLYVTDEESRFF